MTLDEIEKLCEPAHKRAEGNPLAYDAWFFQPMRNAELARLVPRLLKVARAAKVISASVHSSGDPYPVGIDDLDGALKELEEGAP
jgi:hypothetical protein